MSGPKCARVTPSPQEILRAALQAQRRHSARDRNALERALELARERARAAAVTARQAENELAQRAALATESPESARAAGAGAAKAAARAAVSTSAAGAAQAQLASAAQLESSASAMIAANRFDSAQAVLGEATAARNQARPGVLEAARQAEEARIAANAARAALAGAAAEAKARREAEEVLRRERETERRRAALAVESAAEVVRRIEAMPVDKLRPGSAKPILADLAAARSELAAGHAEKAREVAARVAETGGALARELETALAERTKVRMEAAAAVDDLGAAVAAADADLVRSWSASPEGLERAREAHREATALLAADEEDPARAVAIVREAALALGAAVDSATANAAADERRCSVGQAVMDTLRDMGFDVSFEPGTLTEPMRIAGQTPDESGRGDFDIAIPLEGEVGFTVETPRGDAGCIGAVEQLQRRLQERGVTWETTDWGHAQGLVDQRPPGAQQEGRERVQEQERERQRPR